MIAALHAAILDLRLALWNLRRAQDGRPGGAKWLAAANVALRLARMELAYAQAYAEQAAVSS